MTQPAYSDAALDRVTRADAELLAAPQIRAAVQHLTTDPSTVVRWPFPPLDGLTESLGTGGDVWLVAAGTGSGKTSFVASATEAWRHEGKRVYVMPLESQPKRFRTYLGCVRLEISPGIALSHRLMNEQNGASKRAALVAEVEAQFHPPFIDQVMVDPVATIGVKELERGLRRAKGWGADVIVIDHIDHIEGGDGTNATADSRKVCHAALKLAQRNDLLIVATTQLNLQASRGGDRLARYAPPQLHQLWVPGVKSQIATGIVGLYRPLRQPGQLETPKEYAGKLAAARNGDANVSDVLAPNTMGVVAMKLRNFGLHEGVRAMLGFRHGAVTREVLT